MPDGGVLRIVTRLATVRRARSACRAYQGIASRFTEDGSSWAGWGQRIFVAVAGGMAALVTGGAAQRP